MKGSRKNALRAWILALGLLLAAFFLAGTAGGKSQDAKNTPAFSAVFCLDVLGSQGEKAPAATSNIADQDDSSRDPARTARQPGTRTASIETWLPLSHDVASFFPSCSAGPLSALARGVVLRL
jgi:hypothetical protein